MAERALRIEVAGPTSEAAVALLCAQQTELSRDHEAPLGTPAAAGGVEGGEALLAALTGAAAHALDGADLRITVDRQ